MTTPGAVKLLALTCSSLIVALAMGEMLLRVFGLAPTVGLVTMDERQYATLPGIFAPNQRLVERQKPKLPFTITIDSLGYRGPSFPRHKPAGEFRLVLAGDSFTFGSYVDDDKTFPSQLEGRLRSRCGKVRVINAGLGGSTIPDHAQIIRRALPLAPDLVLLTFSENDVSDLAQGSMWARLAENRRAKSRLPLSVIYPVLRHTALWHLGLAAAAVRGAGSGAAPSSPGARVTSDEASEGLRARYRREFLAIRDTLAKRRVWFGFAVYPSHYTVSGDRPPTLVRWAMSLADSAAVPAFDFLPALRATGLPSTDLYLLPEDGHPAPRAHAAVAEDLADRLAETDLLPDRCRGIRPTP